MHTVYMETDVPVASKAQNLKLLRMLQLYGSDYWSHWCMCLAHGWATMMATASLVQPGPLVGQSAARRLSLCCGNAASFRLACVVRFCKVCSNNFYSFFVSALNFLTVLIFLITINS